MRLPESPRVFITGAGSGLGRALALELAGRRARVLVGDVCDNGAAETVELVVAAGGTAEAIHCDVSVLADVESAALRAFALWGGVDLVVNNAGVAVGGLVGEVPIADWRWIVDTNLWGVIHGCHVFVPRLVAQGRGWILNVASAAAFAAFPRMAPYNVTKAGVASLSETLYAEVGGRGIHVSVLCPTFFPTNLMRTFRSPDPRVGATAGALFRRARWTAADVARVAIRDLERGRLTILAQRDSWLVWTLKRWFPGVYHWALRSKARQRTEDRLARER